jgi:hypothetical protein
MNFQATMHLLQASMESFKALGERANVLIRPHARIPLERFAVFEDSCIKLTWRTLIARFVDDPVFAVELAERQRGEMKYWGQSDNKVAERLASLVLEVVTDAARLSRDALFRSSLVAG